MSSFDHTFDSEVHEVRCIEVMTGDVRRRNWTAGEKGRIVAESLVPGVVVSEVARRHGLRPQQLFAWRHEAKRGRLALPEEMMSVLARGSMDHRSDDAVGFVPVKAVADDASNVADVRAPSPSLSCSCAVRSASGGAEWIEVAFGDAVVRVRSGSDAKLLALVLAAVKAVA